MLTMSENPIISICISKYNEDVNPLLQALCNEINAFQLPVNIYIRDDNSVEDYPITVHSAIVTTNTNTRNLGRSGNRNQLIKDADGQYILFLDGDGFPHNHDFLHRYLKHIKASSADVCSGGRIYPTITPEKEYTLHYRYGILRESPVHNESELKTSNLLIKREVIAQIKFDESLKQYGHEDTLLSKELKIRGFNITHLDNPVIHEELQDNLNFLKKQEEALYSLKILHKKGYTDLTRLQASYNKVSSGILIKILSHPAIIVVLKNILLKFPRSNLRILDLYKLGVFARILSEK